MVILSVNFKHLLDLARSSWEKCNYRPVSSIYTWSRNLVAQSEASFVRYIYRAHCYRPSGRNRTCDSLYIIFGKSLYSENIIYISNWLVSIWIKKVMKQSIFKDLDSWLIKVAWCIATEKDRWSILIWPYENLHRKHRVYKEWTSARRLLHSNLERHYANNFSINLT
jgi:hypothetical protein